MAKSKTGYGSRPLWYWILIYAVIGLIVYGLIYYFVFGQRGSLNYGDSATPSGQQTTPAGY